jgi:hypothetical protein
MVKKKGQTTIINSLHRKLKIEQHKPNPKVFRKGTPCGTRHVTLVINPVNEECSKWTDGTYL